MSLILLLHYSDIDNATTTTTNNNNNNNNDDDNANTYINVLL